MFSQAEITACSKAAHSLKLYRRADLRDDETDESLIDTLYVDPLSNDAVLETMLRDSTTFLVGRKGTGKSTIFQRAQHELRKSSGNVTAYVDIKSVFEAAEVDPVALAQIKKLDVAADDAKIQQILLYQSFIKTILRDIKNELKSHFTKSNFQKVLQRLGLRNSDIEAELEELIEDSLQFSETDLAFLAEVKTKSALGVEHKTAREKSSNRDVNLSKNPSIKFGSLRSSHTSSTQGLNREEETSSFILRTLNITGTLEKLQRILSQLSIKKLYVFIDDFSELPQDAMEIFVDSVLAPLNNWSNELVKFKIAAYPNRIYLGKIDPSKMDEVPLDLFRLYGGSDVSTMEEKAIDFTQRLIASRFEHFVKKPFSDFCDSDIENVYRQLYFASMANPRSLGHILSNLFESVTAYDRLIGVRAVQDASQKYYEEKIEPFFGMQKFAHEGFSERASIFSLKELLEEVVERARSLREYKDSSVTREISGRTPSSHFHIASQLDQTLSTLELNFFITLYYEMKDRDGRKVSVYALNHGLCQKFGISFGRPSGSRKHRLYFVERIFDYTSILRSFLIRNQEIKCDNCSVVYDLDKLESLQLFDMMCPSCKEGTCHVINLSKKYEETLRRVAPELILPQTELGILETLFSEKRQMVAAEIAGELDCSYQLVGRRGRNLSDRELVVRDRNPSGRRVFQITKEAIEDYFDNNEERTLDVDPD